MSILSKADDFPVINIDPGTIKILKEFLEKQEECPFYTEEGYQEVWFKGENNKSELRLLTLSKLQLKVSRVEFVNKRQGTMTEVFEVIKNFCTENGIEKIVIESVQTLEMEHWCRKNGLSPNLHCSYPRNKCIFGNWEYYL